MIKVCTICRKEIRATQYATVRQEWLDKNKAWSVAPKEIVHITYDNRERKVKARRAR